MDSLDHIKATIRTVGPVYSDHQPRKGRIRPFGFFSNSDDSLIQETAILNTVCRTVVPTNPVSPDPSQSRKFDKPIFYGGWMAPHFGHFMTTSTGRLWGLDECDPEIEILFSTDYRPMYYQKYVKILKALGINNKIHLIPFTQQTMIDQMVVTNEAYGEQYQGRSLPAYQNWMKNLTEPYRGKIEKGRKIYVSRSRLGDLDGRYANEDHLERLLEKNGYHIIYPEALNAEQQLEEYSKAETLIFAEGSAIHLYAMVKQPEQNAIWIARRPEPDLLIFNQPDAVVAEPRVKSIQAIKEFMRPPVRKVNAGVSVLDFDVLREQFIEMGALDPAGYWEAPNEKAVQESLYQGRDEGFKYLTQLEWEQLIKKIRQKRKKNQRENSMQS